LTGADISLVAIEGYSFGSKNNQFQLGEVGGVVRLLLTQREISYLVVPPNVLKKWTTGSGTADKIAMAVSTFDQVGLALR
jgi:Holliday junction resolvasome RuvABC endonuclease subunit